ncbi:MAG: hypothetical protein CMF28_03830 [Kiritimatiellaceae bacterium]|nr:hypothetical protein [Kiritimatiellaceae bacterium]RZO84893.1 MAG: hypothetical protein EVA58_05295 [Kiritimatiellaceae bacterium]
MAAKKRGRSKRRQEVQVPFPTLLVGVLVFLVVIGAGYMSINIRCAGLGKAIKTQESVLAEARKRLMVEMDMWSSRTAPINLERALVHHGLEMEMPESDQVIRIEALERAGEQVVRVNGRIR